MLASIPLLRFQPTGMTSPLNSQVRVEDPESTACGVYYEEYTNGRKQYHATQLFDHVAFIQEPQSNLRTRKPKASKQLKPVHQASRLKETTGDDQRRVAA